MLVSTIPVSDFDLDDEEPKDKPTSDGGIHAEGIDGLAHLLKDID